MTMETIEVGSKEEMDTGCVFPFLVVDLVQDVYLRIVVKWKSFDEEQSLSMMWFADRSNKHHVRKGVPLIIEGRDILRDIIVHIVSLSETLLSTS